MSINIHIEKKDLWLLSVIVVFLVGVGFIIAYGSGNPQVHGHDAGEIDITLECVSGYYVEPGGPEEKYIYPSTEGNIYDFNDVFQEGVRIIGGKEAPTLECINGWIMTGCSAETRGENPADNDEVMDGEICVGDQEGGENTIYARCCRLK